MRSWATAAASGIILEDAAFSADAAVTRNRLVTNCESGLVAHRLTASGEEFTHVVAPRDRRASLAAVCHFFLGCRAVWFTVPRGRNGQRVLPSLERDPQGLPDGDGWRLADPAAHHPSSGQPGLVDEAQALSPLGVRWTEPAAPAQPQSKRLFIHDSAAPCGSHGADGSPIPRPAGAAHEESTHGGVPGPPR